MFIRKIFKLLVLFLAPCLDVYCFIYAISALFRAYDKETQNYIFILCAISSAINLAALVVTRNESKKNK